MMTQTLTPSRAVPAVLEIDNRLWLERLSGEHTTALHTARMTNRQTNLYWGQLDEDFTVAELGSEIERSAEHTRMGSAADFVVVRDGLVAGETGFKSRRGRTAYANYWIDKTLWGQRVGRQVLGRLLDFGFNAWGLDGTRLAIHDDNRRSQILAQRFGAVPLKHISGSFYEDDEPFTLWEISRED